MWLEEEKGGPHVFFNVTFSTDQFRSLYGLKIRSPFSQFVQKFKFSSYIKKLIHISANRGSWDAELPHPKVE